MIDEFPKFSLLTIEHQEQFETIADLFEPYAEFSFPCLFSWNTNNETAVSLLNDNLVINMPDYLTGDPFYSVIGNNEIDETLRILLKNFDHLRLVPEIVVDSISDKKSFVITEDRDQFDYVYALEEHAQLIGNHFKNRRNKSQKFYKTYEDQLVLKKINFKNSRHHDEVLKAFRAWAVSRNKTHKETKHEEIALKRLLENAAHFKLIGILIYIDDVCAGFSINEVINPEYAICRFHKSVLSYSYIDAFFTHVVSIELQHYGCKFISWEQDLGIVGLRKFKESYQPVKYLKKYTITKL